MHPNLTFLLVIGVFLVVPIKTDPSIALNQQMVRVTSGAATVWDLNTFFKLNDTQVGPINSYSIEGNSPCFIQKSDHSLRKLSSFVEKQQIIDYEIKDNKIYYISNYKVYSIDLSKLINKKDQAPNKMLDLTPYNFTYVNVVSTTSSELLFLLMGDDSVLFYAPFNVERNEPYSMQSLDFPFYDFKKHMKIVTHKEFLFIPAGRQGLYVYKYNDKTKMLEFVKNFDIAKDARDVFLKTVNDLLLVIITDYSKGLISFQLDTSTMDAYKTHVSKEYSRVKAATMITKDGKDKLLMIAETESDLDQFVSIALNYGPALTITESTLIKLDTKILHGSGIYVTASEDFTAVIMTDSIMIIHPKEDITEHVPKKDAHNSRAQKISESSSGLLALSERTFFLADLLSTKKLLVCHELNKDYNFTIIGKSDACRLSYGIGNCDYTVKMQMTHDVKTEQFIRIPAEGITGLGIFMLLVIIVPVTAIVTILVKSYTEEEKAQKTYTEVDQEMESISRTNNLKV